MAITLNGTTGVTTTGLTSNGIDDNATSTAMTLDTSGNLLVGKSASSGSTQGAQLQAAGNVFATVSNDYPLYLNRLGSNGQIAQFRKDGTQVGSIGIESGGLTIDGEAGHAGLRFGGADISPRDGGADADNAIQLGSTVNRFTDLYLSGGVYLGGTGAANKLDDYESGTWTPTLAGTGGNPTVTYSKQQGRYTKIGRTVYCEFDIQITAKSGGSGGARINGLPFTKSNDNPQYAGDLGMIRGGRSDALDSTHRQTVFAGTVLANTTEFELAYTSSIGAAVSYSVTSDIGTGRIVGTFQYIAS